MTCSASPGCEDGGPAGQLVPGLYEALTGHRLGWQRPEVSSGPRVLDCQSVLTVDLEGGSVSCVWPVGFSRHGTGSPGGVSPASRVGLPGSRDAAFAGTVSLCWIVLLKGALQGGPTWREDP